MVGAGNDSLDAIISRILTELCLVNSSLQNLSKRLNYVRSGIVFLNANNPLSRRGEGGEGRGEVSGLVIIISSAD